jgi:hypothetical protein
VRSLTDGIQMTQLDPDAGAWCLDERSRKVTRPALTTLMMIMLGFMIVMDVLKRRRAARS